MDYTTIQNAATKIVDNLKTIDGSINALQNRQDIISTSDMSMANSHNGKLKIEEIGGKCEQFTTTGKNLINYGGCVEKIINGITFTPVYDNDGNLRYINVNGTATANAIYGITSDLIDMTAGNNYVLSGCPIGGSLTTYRIHLYNSDGNKKFVHNMGDEVPFTFTNTTVDYNVSIQINNGYSANNLKFYPMIRLASITDPTYEPYTGGIPAPNPDYPQEIKKVVVSEVKTHGKNVLKHIVSSRTTSGLDVKASKEVISVSGTNSSAITISVCDTTIKNTKGLFVKAPKVRSGINYIARVHRGDSISYLHVLENGLYIPAGGDIGRLYLQQNTVNTTIDLELEPQIVEGFEDSIFEPYTESIIKLSEPIELYGIGDVKDTIEDGKVVRRFGKTSLVNATWIKNSEYEYYTSFDDSKYKPENYTTIFCDKIINGRKGVFINSYGKIRLHIETHDDTIEAVAEAMNNSTIIAELAEPITEPLPAVDQIALNNLSTYDTVTYLYFDSEIEPIFKAEYGVTEIGGRVLEDLMTGLNSEILAQSDADRITALESTIVNNI